MNGTLMAGRRCNYGRLVAAESARNGRPTSVRQAFLSVLPAQGGRHNYICWLAGLWLAAACLGPVALAGDATKLPFDTYGGYFVSNKFEPDAPQSFVVIRDQAQFDKTFGVAFVMRDKSHRLPPSGFWDLMVIAAIHRGNAMWTYKVDSVVVQAGVVELRYTATAKKNDTATYACPLIVSIPKSAYQAVQFVENGKPVQKVVLAEKPEKSG